MISSVPRKRNLYPEGTTRAVVLNVPSVHWASRVNPPLVNGPEVVVLLVTVMEVSDPSPNSLLISVRSSATCGTRNAGDPEVPSYGDAKNLLPDWLAHESPIVPEFVMGDPVTESSDGTDTSTLVTVPAAEALMVDPVIVRPVPSVISCTAPDPESPRPRSLEAADTFCILA